MKFYKQIAIILALLLVGSMACSCQTLKKSQTKILDKTIRAYHTAVQFNNRERAASFIDMDKRDDYYEIFDKMMKNLSVSDFKVRRIKMDEEKTSATVVIVREAYNNSTYEVKSETITQEWEKDGGSWTLVGGGY